MTKGDAGMNEEARTGYWKELQNRIKKPKVGSRIEKISGWGWMHICIFFIYILLLSERDKEAKERALTGTGRGCARYVIYTSGNHAPERGTADRRLTYQIRRSIMVSYFDRGLLELWLQHDVNKELGSDTIEKTCVWTRTSLHASPARWHGRKHKDTFRKLHGQLKEYSKAYRDVTSR